MHKILIAENIPSLNKGELAILKGILESLRYLGDVELSVFSAFPEIDGPRYGNEIKIIDVRKSLYILCNPLTCTRNLGIIISVLVTIQHILFLIIYKLIGRNALKFMRSEIWREYADSDAIFIGHDGTFGIGGNLLPKVSFFSYFSYLYIPFMGEILHKPLVIYGGSVPKFKQSHKLMWRWLAFLLDKIDLITLREESAYKNLRDMKVKNTNVFETADLAFLLKPSSSERTEELLKYEGIDRMQRPLVGITVTRGIASKSSLGLNSKSNYYEHIKVIVNAIDHLIDNNGASIIFLPHCIGFGENRDDRIVSKDIMDLCNNKANIKLITNEYSEEELKGLLGRFDLFIGERLHSVIGSMSMCIPSIIICSSEDQRLDIIKMIGQESAICYVEKMQTGDLISKIEETLGKSDQLKLELKDQIRCMKEKSQSNSILLKNILNKGPE